MAARPGRLLAVIGDEVTEIANDSCLRELRVSDELGCCRIHALDFCSEVLEK